MRLLRLGRFAPGWSGVFLRLAHFEFRVDMDDFVLGDRQHAHRQRLEPDKLSDFALWRGPIVLRWWMIGLPHGRRLAQWIMSVNRYEP